MSAATPASSRWLLLYDGDCRLCVGGSDRLVSLARPGLIELVNLRDRAALARHPAIPPDVDFSALRLVTPDGRMTSGAEAIALVLGTRRWWRLITWLYWVPGLRQLTDATYRWVARNRFRILGRVNPEHVCESGTCSLPQNRR